MDKHYNLIHNYDWKNSILDNAKFFKIKIDDQYSRRVVLNSYDMKIIRDYCSINMIVSIQFEGEYINYESYVSNK